MKTQSKSKEGITAPGQINPENYPDFTSDWPIEELRAAIKEGDLSPDVEIFSAEDHLKYAANNSK